MTTQRATQHSETKHLDRDAAECEREGEPTEQETRNEDRTGVLTDDITIPVPETKPTKPSDLDPFVIANGDIQRTVHIAANGGDQPEPLCIVIGTYNGVGYWKTKTQAVYPDLNERFDLCSPCLAAYDRVRGGESQ
jgi:hypothetical protein